MESQDLNRVCYEAYLRKGTLTYHELATLINSEHGTNLNGESLRKRIKKYQSDHDHYSDTEIFREIEMRKQAFRDERTAWTKQNREQARTEANINELMALLEQTGSKLFTQTKPEKNKSSQSMLILLTDWHIGLTFSNRWGQYSTDIARTRLQTLLKQISTIQKTNSSRQCYVMVCGDMVNGAIRRTVQLQNRENVIKQIQIATELLANFTHTLCEMFPKVTLTGCAGNHSRLVENKESAVKDDRLDNVVVWATSLYLKHIKNFEYVEPTDTTIAELKIEGLSVVGVHGDYDAFARGGVHKITAALRKFPDVICMGHLHSPAYMVADGIHVLRGGSLCGSGDDYTVQKRLTGRASQTVAILDRDGIKALYPITL